MNFREILHKGVDSINNTIDKTKKLAESKYNDYQEFNLLKTKSKRFDNMKPYSINNGYPSIGRENYLIEKCLTLNPIMAKNIDEIVPIDETILDIKTGKEEITGFIYSFVITTNYFWIINEKEYKPIRFEDIFKFNFINTSILTQNVNFNDSAITLDGNKNDIEKFINTVCNTEFRKSICIEQSKYLCGITPKCQYLNYYKSGITIDNNKNIVFHNLLKNNKLYNINEIDNIELLLDNNVVILKGRKQNNKILNNTYDCRKMSIKVISKMDEFTIDLIPQNTLNTLVKREDTLFVDNFEFGKAIINKIIELM